MDSHPIWHPAGLHTAVLRRRLRLPADATSAQLRCAATGPFHVYVDGRRVLSGGADPEPLWTQVEVERHRAGALEIAVRAAGGKGAWVRCEGQWLNAAGAPVAEVATDIAWQASAMPWVAGPEDVGAWEGFSALLDPARGDEEDGEWSPVAVLEQQPEPGGPVERAAAEESVEALSMAAFGEVAFAGGQELDFIAAPDRMTTCKCVHREGMLAEGRVPARIQTASPGRAVYAIVDLGRQVTGFPCLRLRGGAGGLVDIGFCGTWGRIDGGARYVCGSGRQEWSGLEARTCRYMALRFHGFDDFCELEHVSLLTHRVEAAQEARLTMYGSLDQVWEVGRASLALSRRETYRPLAAGPADWLRERALALNDYYLTGHLEAARTHLLTSPVPEPEAIDLAHWAAYPLFLEDYLLYSGDGDLARELLASGLRLAAAVEAARGPDGLVADGSGDNRPAALTALCAGALNALARTGQAAGQRRRTGTCRDLAASLRQALLALRVEERGLFADAPGGGCSQLTNALILLFGLESPDRRPRMVASLRGDDVAPVSDLVEAFSLVGGLWEAGAPEMALDAVEAHWTRIADREGPTWQDKTVRPAARPLPGPEYYLGARLIGLRPLEPGFERVEIRPSAGGPVYAGGVFATARGWMEARWQRAPSGAGITINIDLEQAGATQVAVPRCGLRQPTVTIDGETVWRNEKVYPNGMVREISSEADYVVLGLEAGGAHTVVAD